MIWVIEYIDGTAVSEEQMNFQFANKENAKYFYFLDQSYNTVYGFDVSEMRFFINNKKFDFKVKGNYLKLVQYKTASIHLAVDDHTVRSWNFGVETISTTHVEKYIMSITVDREVYLEAVRKDLVFGKVEEKKVRLQ